MQGPKLRAKRYYKETRTKMTIKYACPLCGSEVDRFWLSSKKMWAERCTSCPWSYGTETDKDIRVIKF